MIFLLFTALSVRVLMDLGFKVLVSGLHFDSASDFLPNLKVIFKRPLFWLCVFFGLSNFLAWCLVLTQFDLSYAYPMFSLCYVVIMLCGKFLFNEHLDAYKLTGMGLVLFGSLCLIGS